uniref:Uncharacterized protein n=1 Tax=Chromera velia CCMP2878 TaxID=1169474 RepID=A0A0G4GH54_9ALVE|eukprot:Cvel_21905.t1-p1 / transcript=Cvel_21905.t1 / gene=Cvel_21905 / organism=Chromera_velia_CCMP2878 / gene_product=hypothetical protein / transcript_product=hypothetical protein / location=Cvel_scaffold2098:15414-27759(+) / protein_length=106 / sequence_SO=supercontig / SO=protein_coding / is_pseudo=false
MRCWMARSDGGEGEWETGRYGRGSPPGDACFGSHSFFNSSRVWDSRQPTVLTLLAFKEWLRFSSTSFTSGMALFDQLLIIGILAVVLVGRAEQRVFLGNLEDLSPR